MSDQRVVVVGTGCTGAWVIKKLIDHGFSVLALDAGPRVEPRPSYFRPNAGTNITRELAETVQRRQPVQSSHPIFLEELSDLYVDDVDNPYSTPPDSPYLWLRSRVVGGRSLLWGGVCLRLTGHELSDWPISYEELVPYYELVERALCVTGSELTAAEQRFKERIEGRWSDRSVIATPGVSRSIASEQAPAWPTLTSQGFALLAAERSGLLEVRPNTIAERIELDANGRASALVTVDRTTGARSSVSARAIVVAASTIETTRLLLNSHCPRFPHGLGGNNGLLGRHLMDHPGFGLIGIVPGVASDSGVPADYARGMCIPRFRNLSRRDAEYIRGYGAIGFAGRGLDAYLLPELGEGARFGLWVLIDMLPRRENRVTLSPDRFDKWGIPCAHIECTMSDNEVRMIAEAERELREMLEHAGFVVAEQETQLPGLNIHEVGTARMGTAPESSVVNMDHQVWGIPNLFVADGSLFASIGWQNPTLTMMALAARCGDRLAGLAARREL